MQAIAILHQKLYQQENTTRINMRSYINELVENIRNSSRPWKRVTRQHGYGPIGFARTATDQVIL